MYNRIPFYFNRETMMMMMVMDRQVIVDESMFYTKREF